MNWATLTYRNLKLRPYAKFLLIFSICTLSIAGVVWACAWEDDDSYSIFSPEAFVQKDYTPFFYDNENWYYKMNVETDDINSRFNAQVISEWDEYLKHGINTGTLTYLFFKCNRKNIDSVYSMYQNRSTDTVVQNISKLNKEQVNTLFAYLKLAKDCEEFAVGEYHGWYDGPTPLPAVKTDAERPLTIALNNSKDPFIKERLWFQLVRYHFFNDDTTQSKSGNVNEQAKILTVFNHYKDAFPKNLTWYRALGYVAGYYRRVGDYAEANYLYSRCYDYSFEMKIPSKFSFHPQEEADWQQTLKLAKNNEEKITLWHLLGMEYDPLRAMKEIVALDPRSDKVDIILSRVVNMREAEDDRSYSINKPGADGSYIPPADSNKIFERQEIKLVDSIALRNNTAKPYFWNIAAGYLHYMQQEYVQTGKFYARAEKQLPANDTLAAAQFKMLKILLYVYELKYIDTKTEAKLVEPLTWLKAQGHPPGLRIADCSGKISDLFLKRGDTLMADCFQDTLIKYDNDAWVQRMVNFFNKPNKTAFEKIALKYYYPHSLNELYYHQAMGFVYNDNDKAIELLSKITDMNTDVLPANPFNAHIQDDHDRDQAAPQKHKFTSLEFLKAIRALQTELNAGKDRYKNTLLLANAYYNISYYGNCRGFYGVDVFSPTADYSQDVPRKYYLLARRYAQTNEQKAKCTFMLSKCEHNDSYPNESDPYESLPYKEATSVSAEKYFGELKRNYAKTQYYREVLKECGYFRDFVKAKN